MENCCIFFIRKCWIFFVLFACSDRNKTVKTTANANGSDEEDEDAPQVPLDELLDELTLNDKPETEEPVDADDDDDDEEPDAEMTN